MDAIVVTLPATSITLTSAQLNGRLDNDGGYPYGDLFCEIHYKKTTSPTWIVLPWHLIDMSLAHTFSNVVTGLTSGATYEFYTTATPAK